MEAYRIEVTFKNLTKKQYEDLMKLTQSMIISVNQVGVVAKINNSGKYKVPVKQSEKAADDGYELIPMSEITGEAREIAVRWMDCEDKNWIGQKHKLASDIMNYAKKYAALTSQMEKEKTDHYTGHHECPNCGRVLSIPSILDLCPYCNNETEDDGGL